MSGLDSLGRLTGLVAAVLLLAQVVLMARLPPLEAAYGQDRLAVCTGLCDGPGRAGLAAHSTRASRRRRLARR